MFKIRIDKTDEHHERHRRKSDLATELPACRQAGWERVIRDEGELGWYREYIGENPKREYHKKENVPLVRPDATRADRSRV